VRTDEIAGKNRECERKKPSKNEVTIVKRGFLKALKHKKERWQKPWRGLMGWKVEQTFPRKRGKKKQKRRREGGKLYSGKALQKKRVKRVKHVEAGTPSRGLYLGRL